MAEDESPERELAILGLVTDLRRLILSGCATPEASDSPGDFVTDVLARLSGQMLLAMAAADLGIPGFKGARGRIEVLREGTLLNADVLRAQVAVVIERQIELINRSGNMQ